MAPWGRGSRMPPHRGKHLRRWAQGVPHSPGSGVGSSDPQIPSSREGTEPPLPRQPRPTAGLPKHQSGPACLPHPGSAPLLPHPVPGTPQAAEWGADIALGPKAREARLQQCAPAPAHPQQLGEPPQASRDGCQA